MRNLSQGNRVLLRSTRGLLGATGVASARVTFAKSCLSRMISCCIRNIAAPLTGIRGVVGIAHSLSCSGQHAGNSTG